MTTPRNVVFVLTDQQKHRTLGCTGSPMASTPHLDRLAAGGLNFAQHITTSPVCSPSRAGIFTGQHITQHGLWGNGCALPETVRTVGHDFSDAGYQTAAFGKHHLDPIITRIEKPSTRGFDTWEIAEGDQQLIDDDYFRWLRRNHPDQFVSYLTEMYVQGHDRGYASKLPEPLHLSRWCVNRACDWLEHRRDAAQPFMMYVGFFDPHHAFNPVEPWVSRFADVPVEQPKYRDGSIDTKPAHYQGAWRGMRKTTGDRARMDAIIRAYHAMIAHVDDCIGQLLGTLARLGLDENTTVVFSSDHGEWLGAHGLLWKGPYLADDLLHVPMLIAPADGRGSGRVVDRLTSSVDLRATLLQLAGLPAPEMLGDVHPLADASLTPLPRGERPYVIAEWESNRDDAAGSQRCLRTATHKLVHYPGSDVGELYDLVADPGEFTNRYDDPAMRDVRDRLFEQLQQHGIRPRPDVPCLGGW